MVRGRCIVTIFLCSILTLPIFGRSSVDQFSDYRHGKFSAKQGSGSGDDNEDDSRVAKYVGYFHSTFEDDENIVEQLDELDEGETVDHDCRDFREVLRNDYVKADRCCKILRDWEPVDSTELLSGIHTKRPEPIETLYKQRNTWPVSALEECLSIYLDVHEHADNMLRALRIRAAQTTCTVSRNVRILNSMCCGAKSCNTFKKDRVKNVCKSCKAEGYCTTCQALYLSG